MICKRTPLNNKDQKYEFRPSDSWPSLDYAILGTITVFVAFRAHASTLLELVLACDLSEFLLAPVDISVQCSSVPAL